MWLPFLHRKVETSNLWAEIRFDRFNRLTQQHLKDGVKFWVRKERSRLHSGNKLKVVIFRLVWDFGGRLFDLFLEPLFGLKSRPFLTPKAVPNQRENYQLKGTSTIYTLVKLRSVEPSPSFQDMAVISWTPSSRAMCPRLPQLWQVMPSEPCFGPVAACTLLSRSLVSLMRVWYATTDSQTLATVVAPQWSCTNSATLSGKFRR